MKESHVNWWPIFSLAKKERASGKRIKICELEHGGPLVKWLQFLNGLFSNIFQLLIYLNTFCQNFL